MFFVELLGNFAGIGAEELQGGEEEKGKGGGGR